MSKLQNNYTVWNEEGRPSPPDKILKNTKNKIKSGKWFLGWAGTVDGLGNELFYKGAKENLGAWRAFSP